MTEFNTRIRHRRDTEANWISADPILLDGEIAVVDTNIGDVRFKLGDGTKTYTQLPFQDESVYRALSGKAEADAVISVDGGATVSTLSDIFGEPPYSIEFTDELEELSNITVAAGNDYGTYRLRNVAIVTEVPTQMNDGDIALVIKVGE